MDMQVAEATGQIPLLQRGDRLITQKQHLMFQQRMVELFELAITQGACQINVFHQRTDIRPQWGDI
ncbi:hypothetical protein D3C78_1109890 [compost metagenome]